MRGLLHRAATTALLTLLPSAAWAQTTIGTAGTTGQTGQTTTNTGTGAFSNLLTVLRNDDTIANDQIVYANLKDCQPERQFEFRVKYSLEVPVVEAWLGREGIDCSLPESRKIQGNVTSSDTICRRIGTVTNAVNLKLKVSGARMLDTNGTETNDGADLDDRPIVDGYQCDNVRGQKYNVYILALAKSSEELDASPPWPQAGVAANLKAVFTPYLRRPPAPSDITARPGEQQLGLTFDAPDEYATNTLVEYKTYFDIGTSGGVNVTCGSGLLEQGSIATESTANPNLRSSKRSQKKEGYLPSLEGVELGQSVAASAVTFDPAGNESLPSSPPLCVERIETTGFSELCAADPDCKGSLDSCSLSQGRKPSLLGLSLLAIALGALIQRRRSR